MNDAGFANICVCRGDSYGYQVNFQGSVLKRVNGGTGASMRTALQRRNQAYSNSNRLHRFLMRHYAVGGIVETHDGARQPHPCFRVHLHNLQTGKGAARCLRYGEREGKLANAVYPTRGKCLQRAEALSAVNIEHYNAMVDRFNQRTFDAGIVLAEQEVATLEPALLTLRDTAAERWEAVFNEFFPEGLVNAVDPRER